MWREFKKQADAVRYIAVQYWLHSSFKGVKVVFELGENVHCEMVQLWVMCVFLVKFDAQVVNGAYVA